MSVSTATMGLVELAQFLVANGSFSTVAEAMAALNIVITDGVGATGTAIAVSGGAGQAIVGTIGETALEVAAQAELAATGTNVTTAGIGLLQGETTTGAAALLGMDMGVIAAACAPILGVSLGATLYNDNPQLWTDISQKLLPFCYPGTTTIPTWAEIANDVWQVSIAKRVVEALKELFEEEGIGRPEGSVESTIEGFGSVTVLSSPIVDRNGYKWEFPGVAVPTNQDGKGGKIVCDGPGRIILYNPDGTVHRRTTLYQVTDTGEYGSYSYYTGLGAQGDIYTTEPMGTWSPSSLSGSNRIEIYVKGDRYQPASYPDGTSRWEGTTPSTIPESKPAVIGIDDITGDPITQPMTPISPPQEIPFKEPEYFPDLEPDTIPFPWPEPTTDPHTEPWPTTMPWPLPADQPDWWPVEVPYPYNYPIPQPSPDPLVQPDPTEITDPQSQVEPYIQPLPIPWELPEPQPQPLPQPDPTKPRPPTTTITDIPPFIPPSPPPPEGISPIPLLPGTDPPFAQNVGLVTVYHPTSAQLYAFESWLWVTYADATIDKIWNNPFDGVISLFELYCTPTDIGNRNIHCGFLDSGINSAIISRYTEIDCGTLGIPEYYGNYFDYSPYTKAHIYLPFIGIQELNPDDIVGHAVNVTYKIDEYNGSCIAMITVAKVTEVNGVDVSYSNTMYQFSGNCSVELPLSGGSQASIKSGMMTADAYQQAGQISAVSGLIGGIASLIGGNVAGGMAGIVGGAAGAAYAHANYLQNMLSGKSTVQKSGSFGASHGALGIKTPFITITRPKQIQVPNYNELYGYPAHKMVQIGNCSGYLRCREVHVISATATDEEKSKIEQLLKSGVYISDGGLS